MRLGEYLLRKSINTNGTLESEATPPVITKSPGLSKHRLSLECSGFENTARGGDKDTEASTFRGTR